MAARSVGRNVTKVALRSFADMGEIAKFQVHVVEHVSYKTLGSRSRVHRIGRRVAGRNIAGVLDRLLARLRGDGSGLFDFELGDDLRLAFVEDLKVLLPKITDRVPLGIADHGAHHHQSYVHLECGGLIMSGDLRRVRLDFRRWSGAWGGNLRRGLRECKGGQAKNQITYSRKQANELWTKKPTLDAALGVTSRLASGELLIKTPAIAGGKAGRPAVDASQKPGFPLNFRCCRSVYTRRCRRATGLIEGPMACRPYS